MEAPEEQDESRDLQGPLRTPEGRFQPGQSGNPGGRPKGSKSLRSLLMEALRKRAKDGKGNEKDFYELLAESIIVHAIKGNAALVKLIFDYHEGPPLQKHELSGLVYTPTDLQQVLHQIGELMREFVPRERWEEFGARLEQLDADSAS